MQVCEVCLECAGCTALYVDGHWVIPPDGDCADPKCVCDLPPLARYPNGNIPVDEAQLFNCVPQNRVANSDEFFLRFKEQHTKSKRSTTIKIDIESDGLNNFKLTEKNGNPVWTVTVARINQDLRELGEPFDPSKHNAAVSIFRYDPILGEELPHSVGFETGASSQTIRFDYWELNITRH
jgi:hypothetical protein